MFPESQKKSLANQGRKMTATITIGIPVYNEEQFLERTIISAISQTLSDIDIVISDNCSTDHSFSIARAFADKDRRVKVVRQVQNIGATANFKACLDLAETEFFVWLGGHDTFAAGYLQAAVEVLRSNPDIVMAYPGCTMIDKFDNEIGRAESNIDTTHCMTVRARLYHVIKSLGFCTSIHGVFRTNVLRRAPIKKVIGSDNLILFAVACFGHIKLMPLDGIRYRQVRIESFDESRKRWVRMGVFTEDPNIDPWFELAIEHYRFALSCKEISIIEKIKIVRGFRNLFRHRYQLTDRSYITNGIKSLVRN